MQINQHEYTQEEVFEALKNKGYSIELKDFVGYDETFPNGKEAIRYKDHCAIKPGENCTEKNQWQNVAIKEFQKDFTKPKLV